MKYFFIFSILFSVLVPSVQAALTTDDLERINEIIDPIKTDMAVLKTDVIVLKTDGAVLKTDVAVLKSEFKMLKDTLKDGFDRQNNIIIFCIGLPFALLAIVATVWSILAHRRAKQETFFQRQIDTLTRELETLKQRQIISP